MADDARECPSARQWEDRLGGGGREDVTRGKAMAELEERISETKRETER
jgi:hypothetical protein